MPHSQRMLQRLLRRWNEKKKDASEKLYKIPNGDIKPLKGGKGSYGLRVGGRRIIFSYPKPGEVLIEKIGPRGDVYRGA